MTEECQTRPPLRQQSRFRVLVGILMSLAALFLVAQLIEVDWIPNNTTDGKFDRIQLGMTIREVQDILGRPSYPFSGEPASFEKVIWNFPGDGVIHVYIDTDGKVVNKEWGEHYSKPKKGLKDLISDCLKKLGL